MAYSQALDVGVIIERRKIDNPWQEWNWLPVGLVVGAPPGEPWNELLSDEGHTQFLASALPIELHRAETEAYLYNLMSPHPSVFVVLREDEDGASSQPFEVALVTVSPYEAQDYLDSSEDVVERIAMPEDIRQWVSAFVEQYHRDQPFMKRQRDKVRVDDHKFGQESLVELRRRMNQARKHESDG